jgi:tRNA uridine 5-carboxymethylaminomethyl modification enzyme
MFTSRAEYRISLRADNADLRLTRKGMEFDLVKDDQRMAALETREFLIDDRIEKLRKFELKVTEWAERGGNDLMGGAQLGKKSGNKKTAEDVLQMPHVTLKHVEDVMLAVEQEKQESSQEEPDLERTMASPPSVFDTVEASVKYKSYVLRQHRDMNSWRKAQGRSIPPDLDYAHEKFPTFSKEELEKLARFQPTTFAEASQISGVTPQSLVYLYHYVTGRNKKRDGNVGSTAQKDNKAATTMAATSET